MTIDVITKVLGITKPKITRIAQRVTKTEDSTLSDVFVKQAENIDLSNIKLGRFINEGREAQVFESNYPDYVIRISHGKMLNPRELKKVEDTNCLIYATDEQNYVQILKKVQGEPLYGKGWYLLEDSSVDKFIIEFEKIRNLPDISFRNYFQNVLSLRKSGFNTDVVSPNNFLIDNNKINIVDIAQEEVESKLTIKDIYPFVDNFKLQKLLMSMSKEERDILIPKIRAFLGRMIRISRSAGSKIEIDTSKNISNKELLVHIYNDNKYILNLLLD